MIQKFIISSVSMIAICAAPAYAVNCSEKPEKCEKKIEKLEDKNFKICQDKLIETQEIDIPEQSFDNEIEISDINTKYDNKILKKDQSCENKEEKIELQIADTVIDEAQYAWLCLVEDTKYCDKAAKATLKIINLNNKKEITQTKCAGSITKYESQRTSKLNKQANKNSKLLTKMDNNFNKYVQKYCKNIKKSVNKYDANITELGDCISQEAYVLASDCL